MLCTRSASLTSKTRISSKSPKGTCENFRHVAYSVTAVQASRLRDAIHEPRHFVAERCSISSIVATVSSTVSW